MTPQEQDNRSRLIHAVLFSDKCWHKCEAIKEQYICSKCDYIFKDYQVDYAGYHKAPIVNPNYFSRTSDAFWKMKEEAEKQEWHSNFVYRKLLRHRYGILDMEVTIKFITPEYYATLLSDFIRDMVIRERDEKCECKGNQEIKWKCEGEGEPHPHYYTDREKGSGSKCWLGSFVKEFNCKCKGTGKRWSPDIIKLAEGVRK